MSPDTKSRCVKAMQAEYQLITDLLGGTSAVRKKGEDYLKRNPSESMKAYQNRVDNAVLYPAFSQTVETTASRPFKKPTKLKSNVPDAVASLLSDIDLEGQNLTCFANQVLEVACAYGISYVLVDYPLGVEFNTRQDELDAGVRPYCVHIHPTSVIGISTDKIGGVKVLSEFRYQEQIVVQNEDFSEDVIEQIRVIRRDSWQLWQKLKDEKGVENFVMVNEGVNTLGRVPVVPVYTNRTGFYTGTPLFLELAKMNIEHYNSRSEQQNILHVARVPLLTVIGSDETTDVVAGMGTLTQLPIDADMKYVEHSGASIGAGRQDIQDLEERMRQAGAELLQRRVTVATATEVSIEANAQMTVLGRIAMDLEDALARILQFMAEWIGLPDGGQVEVFKDFTPVDDTVTLNALQMLYSANAISRQGLFEMAYKTGFLDDNMTWAKEVERMELELPMLQPEPSIVEVLPNFERIGQ